MNFYDVVTRRRTVREFSPAPVAEAIVTRALEAGLKAPSNAHLKYWQFILLRDAERRREAATEYLRARDIKEKTEIEAFLGGFEDETLKKVYRRTLPIQLTMMLEAPEVLVVCYKMKPLSQCRTLFELNPLASVWMCIENIMLAMAAEGLFGCTYTPYDAGGVKKFLGVPEGFEIASVIPFGYPRNVAEDRDNETLAGRLHIDKW
ncbi:MAG: nitroreductase family protein [Candidatus Aminicenantales bacterium]